MKQKTKKPSKQRKRERNAPLHKRQKKMSTVLKPELREEFGRRRIQVKKGDKVKVMRGSHKGKKGKVEKVNLEDYTVEIKDIERETQDQERVNIKFHPSNLIITKLELKDKKREEKLQKNKIKEDENDESKQE